MGKRSKILRFIHTPSGEVLAEGPVGWGITPFEGNYYVQERYVCSRRFRGTPAIGFCSYKFLYVWVDYLAASGDVSRHLGWMYIVPNPLLPFIAFRLALPSAHPDITIEQASV